MIGLDRKPDDLVMKQALAAIGQVGLIRLYQKFFDENNKTVAQVLLTRDGIENSLRRKEWLSTVAKEKEDLINRRADSIREAAAGYITKRGEIMKSKCCKKFRKKKACKDCPLNPKKRKKQK